MQFLDETLSKPDVWVVSQKQALEWMKVRGVAAHLPTKSLVRQLFPFFFWFSARRRATLISWRTLTRGTAKRLHQARSPALTAKSLCAGSFRYVGSAFSACSVRLTIL